MNEPNRFGYIVEIDPSDPTATPLKHTAMGRFKHEGANVTIAEDGRVVAYMGDDERNDYLYKFVSKGRYTAATSTGARTKNMRLLSEGDLYVARFSGNSPAGEITGGGALPSDGLFDGSGQWLALTRNGESVVPGMSTEEVLVYTRLAADKVGEAWSYVVDGRRNRRITVETVFELTGPAAGSDLVKTAADAEGRWVKGTLGNCAGGTTPWGTVLSGEENFNGYFAWAADTADQQRYSGTSSTSTET